MMLPTELQRLLDEIGACERDAESLVADLDDREVNWKPPGDVHWSVAQCLNHLTVTNEFYLRGCAQRLREARAAGLTPFSGLHPTLLGRWFIGSLEPPPRFKVQAPTQVVPAPTLPLDELLPAYKASHSEYRRLVEASADLDINRVIAPNPFFNRVKMRLSTMLLVMPAHDRRHLWQAKNVKLALRAGRGS